MKAQSCLISELDYRASCPLAHLASLPCGLSLHMAERAHSPGSLCSGVFPAGEPGILHVEIQGTKRKQNLCDPLNPSSKVAPLVFLHSVVKAQTSLKEGNKLLIREVSWGKQKDCCQNL